MTVMKLILASQCVAMRREIPRPGLTGVRQAGEENNFT